MKFTLTISLGNAAMLTGFDIANALRGVADKVEMLGDDEMETADAYDRSGLIMDANGNTIGEWGAK